MIAWWMPGHALTGCGAFQRKSPTGGAANGMPLNCETPSTTVPATVPPVTLTCEICAIAAAGAAASANAIIETAQVPFMFDPSAMLESVSSRASNKAYVKTMSMRVEAHNP